MHRSILGLPATLALLSGVAVHAATLPDDPLEQRCWLQHTRERTAINLREPTAVEFSNLRDGWRVRTPFVVDFAVRGMGVAPAGVKAAGTGHHHLLVNRSLPVNIASPIPFDDSHRHFGKGQTRTLLELPPGRHRLRLLFADHDHRPHFVFSREITVQVLGPRSSVPRPKIDPANFDATCQAWYEEETSAPVPPQQALSFLNVRDGEAVVSPFNLRLAVDGFGICAASVPAQKETEKTGHFIVDVFDAASRQPVQSVELVNGATQLNAFVPPGEYRVRLRLVDRRRADLAPAHEIGLRVLRQEAL
jgi:Domain of unknown function (DUF4399)